MKHSDKISKYLLAHMPAILMWAVPVTLVIPNVLLCFTEVQYSMADRVANVALPLGIYLLVCGVVRRIGWAGVCMLPLAVLCAFQIVLLFLYGESIIAIDMFLNVVTTNVHEATELLRNMWGAIITVCLIYLPPVGLGIWMLCRKAETTPGQRHTALAAGGILTFAGMCAMAYGFATDDSYAPSRKLFPVNIISNINTAAARTAMSNAYPVTSAPFSFEARRTRTDSVPEVFVMVIGETSRAGNWGLNGYYRPTTPRLSARGDEVISFRRTLSESNTTHKSVPLMLSHLDCAGFGDSIYRVKGVAEAFREAGFRTAFFSNQARNGSLIDFFGEQAQTHRFLSDDDAVRSDRDLALPLREFIAANDSAGVFVILHTYGSHFNYRERYDPAQALFTPDDFSEATGAQRDRLLNSYDNSIAATDATLDSIISVLEISGRPAAMLYLADHGEDIYDDSRNRFLHASPTPTYYQLHVPMIMWMSDNFRSAHPALYATARSHGESAVSGSRSAFHTLLDMAGIVSPKLDRRAALTDTAYTEPVRLYLNDYNEAVPLDKSGLRSPDYSQLRNSGTLY